MNKRVLFPYLVISGLTLLGGLWQMMREARRESRLPPLTVFCAASLRAPVEAAAKEYEKEFGTRIHLFYGGSHTLLANLEVSRTGDLYIPADHSYVEMARDKALLQQIHPLAEMTPMLAVMKDNPKHIRSLADLARPGVKLSQANPDAAAIGKVVRAALQRRGRWDDLAARTTVFKGTVNDAANDVVLGAVDAAFVWDAMAGQYPALQFIALPELENASASVSAVVLTSSRRMKDSIRFASYLRTRDKGLKHFEKNGFRVVPSNGGTNETKPG